MAGMGSGFAGTDRFEVIREMGAGGMGVVYEVLDREREQRVALKTLRHTDADRIYRLKREFRALADLSHPNLVDFHELFVDDSQCFFTMELVRGKNFLEYCLGRQPDQPIASDEARLRETLPQLVQGIQALHAAGKVHRDIKPSNVLVTEDKRVVILDFGLIADIKPDERNTYKGMVVGTPEYMAPEQGDGEATAASDWYGVGIMLYEALTGRVPFSGPVLEVLFAKLRRAPPPPRAIVPDVPEDLDELCVELLARDSKHRPSGVQVMRALGVDETTVTSFPQSTSSEAHARGPFAGRQEELERLTAAYDRVERGETAVVLIQGLSGIGKSELTREFLRQTEQRFPGRALLQGRCYLREAVPYSAMDSLIDDLSRMWTAMPDKEARALLPRRAAALSRVFPVLGRVPVVAGARERLQVTNLQELRTRAFAALREVLQRLGEQYPLVLHLDDMQWVDADTVTLLADLMRPPDPPALLLLLCSRDFAPLERMLHNLGANADLIALEPLDRDESLELAKQLLGPRNRALAHWIANEAAGSPFFLGELARYSHSVGSVYDAAPRLDDLIAGRISSLPEASRRLLEVMAVAGEPLATRIVGSATRLDEQALTREIRFLRVGHLVRTVARRPDMRIELYHDRIREAVFATLPEVDRMKHHESLAVALEQWGGGSAERLATHWRGAGRGPRAAEHALRAAEEANGKLDFDRAAGHYEMTLAEGNYDENERRRLLILLGECQSNAGRPHAAGQSFLSAAAGADAATRLDLQRRSAEELLCGGYQEEGLAAIRAVLAEIGLTLAGAPSRAVARLLWQRARLRMRGLRYKRRDESELAPAKLTRADACWSVGWGLGFVDTLRAAEYQTRNLLLALDLGEENRIARAMTMEASFLGVQGIGPRARQLTQRARELAGGDLYVEALALRADSSVDFFVENNWAVAAEKLDAAAEIWRTHYSTGYDVDTCVLFSSFCNLFRGDIVRLARRVPAYAQEADRRGDRFASVCMRTRINILWLLRDNVDGARYDLDDAIGSWLPWDKSFQVPHWYALFSGSELELYAGEPEAAAELLDSRARALKRSLLLRVPMVTAETLHLRGRVELAQAAGAERPAAAVRSVRRLARKLGRLHQPIGPGFAQLLAAGAAQVAGDTDACAGHLRDAIETLEGIEMMLYATAAKRRLGGVIGGDEGAELVDAANAWMHERDIKNPSRITAMFVPGWKD